MAGYSGRGRQNRRTNGPIQPAYSLGGYRAFLPIANTPTSVANVATILERDPRLFRAFVNTLATVKDLLRTLLEIGQYKIIFLAFYSRGLVWVISREDV